MDIISVVQEEMLRAAVMMLAKKEFHHLLYIGDLPLPEEVVKSKSAARKKLVQAVTNEAQRQLVEAMGVEALSLPMYHIARRERFKMALVDGISRGIFREGDVVLGLVGRSPTSYPDTMMVVTIGGTTDDGLTTGFGMIGNNRIPSPIIESIIELAVEVGRDGWEGHAVGTLLVVGDSPKVMEKSHQLTLNPFQGYSETEKNILNPVVRDAIKNFSVLDGAFVVREDGVVLAAGRYLKFDNRKEVDVPLGFGARHVAAAGISLDTNAIAVVVSETTGTVRVYQQGTCVLEIHPEQKTRRSGGSNEAFGSEQMIEWIEEPSRPGAGRLKDTRPPSVEMNGNGEPSDPANREGRESRQRDVRASREVRMTRETKAKK